MIRTLLPLFLASLTLQGWAQCTPDPLYQDSLYGVWPDTTTNFAPASLGQPYLQQLDLKAPSDAGAIDPEYQGFTLHSIRLVGVTGMPPGLDYACASQGINPCTFLANQLGCGVISGTPTEIGVFELALEVLPFLPNPFDPNNPIQSPFGTITFGGYRIAVTEGGVGVAEVTGPALGQVRNVPNPFANRTHIEFGVAKSGPVKVKVFNLLGEELWSTTVQAKAGNNRVPFEAGVLSEGVYLYKVEAGQSVYTGRMLLNR